MARQIFISNSQPSEKEEPNGSVALFYEVTTTLLKSCSGPKGSCDSVRVRDWEVEGVSHVTVRETLRCSLNVIGSISLCST